MSRDDITDALITDGMQAAHDEQQPSKQKVRRYSGNVEGMVRIDQFGGEGGFVASEDYDAAVAEIERLRAQLHQIAICPTQCLCDRCTKIIQRQPGETKADLKYLCPHSLDSRYCPTCEALSR